MKALIFLFLATPLVFATAQQADVLFIDGKAHRLYSNPLEPFLDTMGDEHRWKLQPYKQGFASSNWRGYVATWKIEKGRLYLTRLDSWICKDWQNQTGCRRASLRKLFGARWRNGCVFADWFTGDLRAPEGEQLMYVHMGYGSVYERDILIKVENGLVKSQTVRQNFPPRVLPLELSRRELEKMKE